MRSVIEECECVICGNEADLVIDCNLVDTTDPDHMKILQKDRDVQVMRLCRNSGFKTSPIQSGKNNQIKPDFRS